MAFTASIICWENSSLAPNFTTAMNSSRVTMQSVRVTVLIWRASFTEMFIYIPPMSVQTRFVLLFYIEANPVPGFDFFLFLFL